MQYKMQNASQSICYDCVKPARNMMILHAEFRVDFSIASHRNQGVNGVENG